ncbi:MULTISPECIES: hypothetical protein [Alteromonas]|jgi:hypothetical protein|uniref:Uncharacterized protein n=1 Tax=Alteromonas stellipolaris TaxID=233316 RepID=A0AAW7Z3R3_9ALTE|nr:MULTISPECIES: hypothetical protein [Alteromonas]AMJ92328.1 hypothetical protein AV940_18690 [Alteromonas sp. Mac2]AMJ88474.1 hypothetical protein AV939_18995 [Alteromonas sp. Mac1]AMJ96166.1 hypothetical protein AVL56_18845 [Alteromonas stellipolaris]ANB20808.1 hypothetical protein A6K25_05615 [Alteromonas stellipolaris]ANB25313.1 hypothetical protein A6F57_08945 [Alteromonas stellipolaris]
MKTPIIPLSYEQWKHCIIVECGIPLTATFVDERIAAMSDVKNEYTRQFLICYGKNHYENTLRWLTQAKESLS